MTVGRGRAAVACALAAGLGVGCGEARPAAEVRSEVGDSGGVVVVTNHGVPSTTPAAPVLQIGELGLEGDDDRYVFHLISDIEVMADGRIVVIDNRAGRIAVFDAGGQWVEDLGRSGRGPGEHEAPIHASTVGDTVFVWDALLRRLNAYRPGAGFVGAITLRERTTALDIVAVPGALIDEVEWGQNLDPAPAGGALLRRPRRDGGDSGAAASAADTLAGPYAVPEFGWEWIEEGQRGMMVNPPAFEVRPDWAVRQGPDGLEVVRVRSGTATLEVLDAEDGRLRRLIRLDRAIGPPSGADRDAWVEARATRWALTPERAARLRESTVWADQRPAFSALIADDDGRIWVAEHDPGAAPERQYVASVWDVLDRDGRLGRRVRFPPEFELKTVRGSRAYGVVRDEDGVESVAVYAVD